MSAKAFIYTVPDEGADAYGVIGLLDRGDQLRNCTVPLLFSSKDEANDACKRFRENILEELDPTSACILAGAVAAYPNLKYTLMGRKIILALANREIIVSLSSGTRASKIRQALRHMELYAPSATVVVR